MSSSNWPEVRCSAAPFWEPEIAGAAGARLLTGDPVTEAEHIQWPR